MKKRLPLYAVLPILLLVAVTVFTATFLPTYYRLEKEKAALRAELESVTSRPPQYDAARLEAALDYLTKYSVYALPDSDALTEAMIESVLAAMGDPYATYYTPKEHEERLAANAGSYYGVGITVTKTADGYAEILLIHEGSPLMGKGEVGDLIVAVDGVGLKTLGYDEAIDRIGGTKETVGQQVSLTLLRGGETLTVSVTRAEITKQSVISKSLTESGKRLGYVLLTGFDASTVTQLREAVLAHEAAGVDGLIFDVRSNGGGLLYSVAEILAFLLPDGEIAHVDYASDRLSDYGISAKDGTLRIGSASPTVYYEGGHAVSVPMTVLINGSSASAAELFAKAIDDYADAGLVRASLVGTQSFGKGTVQTTDSSPFDGGAIKITVATYTPPSGVCYDGVGITPDHTVELPDEYAGKSILSLTRESDTQLAAAIDTLLAMLSNG